MGGENKGYLAWTWTMAIKRNGDSTSMRSVDSDEGEPDSEDAQAEFSVSGSGFQSRSPACQHKLTAYQRGI